MPSNFRRTFLMMPKEPFPIISRGSYKSNGEDIFAMTISPSKSVSNRLKHCVEKVEDEESPVSNERYMLCVRLVTVLRIELERARPQNAYRHVSACQYHFSWRRRHSTGAD